MADQELNNFNRTVQIVSSADVLVGASPVEIQLVDAYLDFAAGLATEFGRPLEPQERALVSVYLADAIDSTAGLSPNTRFAPDDLSALFSGRRAEEKRQQELLERESRKLEITKAIKDLGFSEKEITDLVGRPASSNRTRFQRAKPSATFQRAKKPVAQPEPQASSVSARATPDVNPVSEPALAVTDDKRHKASEPSPIATVVDAAEPVVTRSTTVPSHLLQRTAQRRNDIQAARDAAEPEVEGHTFVLEHLLEDRERRRLEIAASDATSSSDPIADINEPVDPLDVFSELRTKLGLVPASTEAVAVVPYDSLMQAFRTNREQFENAEERLYSDAQVDALREEIAEIMQRVRVDLWVQAGGDESVFNELTSRFVKESSAYVVSLRQAKNKPVTVVSAEPEARVVADDGIKVDLAQQVAGDILPPASSNSLEEAISLYYSRSLQLQKAMNNLSTPRETVQDLQEALRNATWDLNDALALEAKEDEDEYIRLCAEIRNGFEGYVLGLENTPTPEPTNVTSSNKEVRPATEVVAPWLAVEPEAAKRPPTMAELVAQTKVELHQHRIGEPDAMGNIQIQSVYDFFGNPNKPNVRFQQFEAEIRAAAEREAHNHLGKVTGMDRIKAAKRWVDETVGQTIDAMWDAVQERPTPSDSAKWDSNKRQLRKPVSNIVEQPAIATTPNQDYEQFAAAKKAEIMATVQRLKNNGAVETSKPDVDIIAQLFKGFLNANSKANNLSNMSEYRVYKQLITEYESERLGLTAENLEIGDNEEILARVVDARIASLMPLSLKERAKEADLTSIAKLTVDGAMRAIRRTR